MTNDNASRCPQDVRLCCVCLVGLFLVGCGGGDPEIVPLQGKITFEGREMPAVCRLTFVPTADTSGGKRPNGALMNEDGSYQPTRFRGVQGLYPGHYRVKLSYFDLKPGGNPAADGDWIEQVHEVPDVLTIDAHAGRIQHDIRVPKTSQSNSSQRRAQ